MAQRTVLEESEQAHDQLLTYYMKMLLEYFSAKLRTEGIFKQIIIGNSRIEKDINDGVTRVVQFAT